MSSVNKLIEREKSDRARGNKWLLYLHIVYFQSCNDCDSGLALTGTQFWPWREVGKRMKGLCLLTIPEVPEASFPRAIYLESSILP